MPDTTVGHLWNHAMAPSASYTLYGAASSNYLSTIDEVSRKCLGCHDGTIAVDSFGGHAGTRGVIAAGYVIGASRDLTHDHPIDVLYNSAGNYTLTSTTTNGVTTYLPVWSSSARNNDPATFSITGYTSQKWGLKTYTQTALSAVSFYTPSGALTTVTDSGGHSATTSAKYVYCRSCHDPHNNQYSFLRVPNDGSQLCLTCHNK